MQHAFLNPATLFAIQAILVIGCSRVLALLLRRLQQPSVVAEILAGIVLGPSLLGAVAPEWKTTLFPAPSLPLLGLVSHVGLILFMFLVGLELNTESVRTRPGASVAISHASIAFPMAFGGLLGFHLHASLAPEGVPLLPFVLFLGIAMSITAFPVLARILADQKLLHTSIGDLAIACAAVDDVTAWCLLAVVVSVTRAAGVWQATAPILLAGTYIAIMVCAGRPLLRRYFAPRIRDIGRAEVATVLILVLASSTVTDVIGVHALFGAFLLGAILPREERLTGALASRLEDLVFVLLLPIFFAYSGLRTELGLLDSTSAWLICGLITVVACLGKFGGSALAARLVGLSWADACTLGVLMNTKGLMELVVLNIGLDLGVISKRVFTMMVVMALVTTLMTTPLLRWASAAASRRQSARGPHGYAASKASEATSIRSVP